MHVDWFTVLAQIGNFLVLVWLMQRFLYRPVIDTMDRRERRIAERLRAAVGREDEAEREAAVYRQRQVALASERGQLLDLARESAEEERRTLERSVRTEVAEARDAWLSELASEREAFITELRQRCLVQFWSLARRALDDVANASLEEQMALVLAERIQDLGTQERERLVDAVRAAPMVTVRSRHPLTEASKAKVGDAVRALLGREISVDFVCAPADECGIALEAGSQRIAWSLGAYLDEFADSVRTEAWPQSGTGG